MYYLLAFPLLREIQYQTIFPWTQCLLSWMNKKIIWEGYWLISQLISVYYVQTDIYCYCFKYNVRTSISMLFILIICIFLLLCYWSGTFKFISKCIKGEGISGTKRYFGDLGKTVSSWLFVVYKFFIELQIWYFDQGISAY